MFEAGFDLSEAGFAKLFVPREGVSVYSPMSYSTGSYYSPSIKHSMEHHAGIQTYTTDSGLWVNIYLWFDAVVPNCKVKFTIVFVPV